MLRDMSGANRTYIAAQSRTRLFDLYLQTFHSFRIDVVESTRNVDAVADFCQRGAGDVQKLKLFSFVIARAPLDKVYGDRKCGSSRLRTEFEPLIRRKRRSRKRMQFDE